MYFIFNNLSVRLGLIFLMLKSHEVVFLKAVIAPGL